ncbi:serine hydrolase [Afipia sp. GAS231]|uniref:serine hydrolase domain-containing protein n=1 Tax=Afipia sp. GAS231 TaxID=1882747 RepID=UPI00087A6713|nr:serine hydrolase domain-containing protein [Afipia sp. GAS231]SDO12067.1 CubicO group peptidase, beta-lactamase class C family [Afipia sp. GAS231]
MRLSRRDTLLFTGAVAAASALPRVSAPAIAAAPRTTDIDAILKARVDAGDAPGVVAMAATKDSVIYQGAFGVRAKGTSATMSLDTVFAIASMTKLLTSVAAMQLVERGKLTLDEPAARIDPTLDAPQVLDGFDAKGTPQLRPARKPITLRQLLTHTSGFSYQLWDANVLRYGKIARNDPALPRTPLMFDPDTRWAYGGSLDRVGHLVEIVSGQTLDRYFRDNILDPLGMRDTAYATTDAQRARQANLHIRKPDGTLAAQPLVKQAEPKEFSGGGGIKSTAPDYLTLLQAILNGGGLPGKRILRPQTVEGMSTNQIGDIAAGILRTTSPALSNDVDFFPGIRLRWGLAGMINIDPVREGRAAGSQTWAGLYNTYYWIDPASRIAGVIMMQILPFADRRALNVYRQFERGIYRGARPA